MTSSLRRVTARLWSTPAKAGQTRAKYRLTEWYVQPVSVTETLEFGVLGPLEARSDGRVLPLGSPKQRALLALLLLHANERVSRDRLIDELWGEAPPATAISAFHVYLSRLRKLLGDRLERDTDGYRLRVDDGQVDVARFEHLAREGCDALAEGETQQASDLLHEALELWRGPPLAGLIEPFATAAAARLQEQHLAVLENRLEADLALGHHRSLVAELDALVAEHPFRERLRALQMLALYRSGRQADALAAYQQTRRTLGDELGLEPSPELNALQQSILRHDLDLAPPSSAAGVASRAAASRLPLVLVAAGVIAAATAAAFFLLLDTSSRPAIRISADAVGMFDPRTGRVTGDVDLGSSPSAVAAGAGSIWVADVDGRSVSRLNPVKRVSVQTITVGNGPAAVAVGAGFVWIANGLDSTVSQIDPETNTVVQTIGVGNAPAAIAVGAHGIWVANSRDGTVTELARGTGDVI
jgi:YVTN family beta-propeller protein